MIEALSIPRCLARALALGILAPVAFAAATASAEPGGATGDRNLIMGTGEMREPQPFTREQRLLDAVRRDDRATVEAALDLGVPVDSADDLQRSALLLAARDAGDVELVRFLHERGGAIDRPDSSGRTPLSYAASAGRVELARYLVEQGAEVDRRDRRKRTPLYHAVVGNQPEMVAWLLDHGADVDVKDRFLDTPLIMACAKGEREVAQLLIERGADRSARNQDGRSAEDRAAQGMDICRTPHAN